MNKHNQDGALNVLLIPLLLASFLLIAAIGFSYWAFGERQTYKNDSDQLVAQAVTQAKKEEGASKDKEYFEANKLPLKTYRGPEQYGSVALQYPKTWSAYVDATGSDNPVDGYFQPDTVPSITDKNSSFALRFKVLSDSYSSTLESFEDQEDITATPFSLPKVSQVIGTKITGQIEDDKQGVMVILPVRNTTLEIYTESNDFINDFNNTILPNLSFSP